MTVNRNLAECRRGSVIVAGLGFKDKLYPILGLIPLEDTFGISAAIVMLQLSLNNKKIQKCLL